MLCAVVEPYYLKRGNGRPPIGLERMLQMHSVQHWFNLADFACEEALYDSLSLRRFVGIEPGLRGCAGCDDYAQIPASARKTQAE